MKTKLAPTTITLLEVFAKQHREKQCGIAAITPLPYWVFDRPHGKPTMSNVRALLRHGLIEERCNGIYYLTDEGHLACKSLGIC